MSSSSRTALLVEPYIFEAPAVVDAVDHDRQPLDLGLAAGRAARIEDHRPGNVLDQLPFDLPYQLFALFRIGFHRLPIDQLVDLGVAVAGVVAIRAAYVVFVELLVRVVDPGLGDVET